MLSLLLLLPFVSGSLPPPLGRDYKESCSEAEPCNPIKFLQCVKGKCECISQNEIVYDQRLGVCAALVGFSCLRQIPEDNSKKQAKRSSSSILEQNKKEREIDPSSGKYQISCISHAKCSYPEDTCACEFRYYKAPNNNGSCLRQKGYGQRCLRDEECDKYKFFSCVQGQCGCDKEHRHDAKNDKCFVPVGSSCKVINYKSISEEVMMDDECPEDAICKIKDPDSDFGICECEESLKLTLDKTCGRDFQAECDSRRKCSDVQFVCRNGTCNCKYPLHQTYDEGTKSCVSLSGGPCDLQKGNDSSAIVTGCTEHAFCFESSPFSFCKCSPGFLETNEGTCIKSQGSVCEKDEECDPVAGLACVNNVCNCPDQLQSYDDKHRVCIGLAGGRCRKESQGQRPENPGVPSCTPNAYCVKGNAGMTTGRCVCARTTYLSASRACVKGR